MSEDFSGLIDNLLRAVPALSWVCWKVYRWLVSLSLCLDSCDVSMFVCM